MSKPHIELLIEDESGQDVVAYPFVNANHVSLSNGMNIGEMIDGDVSMPTVTHDTTAINVGVGDSDVSSSIVDSAVNMTIKGQTYQNILPDPTLRNEMQGKSMQRLNEGYDSIETVDGVSKSAILKGQTLVNGLSNPIIKVGGECVVILSPTHLLINHGENTSGKKISVSYDWLGGKMRDGADYTLDIWILKNTMRRKDNPTERIGKINFNNYNTGYYSIPTGKTGHIVYEVTTPTTSTTERPYIETFTTCEGELEIQMVIREGKNLIPIEQHFEGMASCKMPVLQTIGRNLLPTELSSNFEHKTVNGQQISNIDLTTFLKRGVRYVVKLATSKAFKIATFWSANSNNADEVLVGHGTISANNNNTLAYFTLPINDKSYYMFVNEHGENHSNFISDISQLVAIEMDTGKAPTTIEPYKTNILSTPEEVVLRGVGEVKDTLNLNTGEYVQRIKEMVLNGSENYTVVEYIHNNTNLRFDLYINDIKSTTYSELICDSLPVLTDSMLPEGENTKSYIASHANGGRIVIIIEKSKLPSENIEGFKTWLQANPITVQYKLTTPIVKTVDLSIVDQNGGTQENLHSFANGHLQVSSEAENSLLPSVQYEIPTKNSYHMDLMKANTTYTMKLASGNGSINKWDGEAIGFMLSRTFNSGTLPKDNLFYTTGWVNDLMILEGDLNAKTIPYFKGIKSAFEGEDKIEVLSTGANIIYRILGGDLESDEYNFMNILSEYKNTDGALNRAKVIKWVGEDKFFIKGYGIDQFDNQYNINLVPTVLRPNTTYSFYFESIEGSHEQNKSMKLDFEVFNILINETRVARATESGHYTFTTPNQINSINFNLWLSGEKDKNATVYAIFNKFMIVEGKSNNYQFEPYKSNITKIPLLSPLRSLPNGVCDELIIDRLNHKAKLIQRVGEIIFDGSQEWERREAHDVDNYYFFKTSSSIPNFVKETANVNIYCDKIKTDVNISIATELVQVNDEGKVCLKIHKDRIGGTTVEFLKRYLQRSPVTVYCELATPIITEIDLEGYPYVYKDGHIFLNSEVAPTTEIIYSINQAQQIESANENLQRHEKEISHLQKLIAQYIQVEYESTLLSLKV